MKKGHFIARLSDPNTVGSEIFSEWHLMAYEVASISPDQISRDIRDAIQFYPFSKHISICLIDAARSTSIAMATQSTASARAAGASNDLDFSVLVFDPNAKTINYELLHSNQIAPSIQSLPLAVQHAWLYDLFHRHRCLVSAPDGIHFGKTSGKHSSQFLRASNAIMSTLECNLLAFFLLPFASSFKPTALYVDTGPLVSVGMALGRLCCVNGIWPLEPSVESFSSYDGIEILGKAPENHIILISASTSGGLESEVSLRTGFSDRIATFFYLQGEGQAKAGGYKLCDLTEAEGQLYGYPPVKTFANMLACEWCQKGIPYAEFEGDQFLLQKRRPQYINVVFSPQEERCSMKSDAKNFFSNLNGEGVFSVQINAAPIQGYRDVQIDRKSIFGSTSGTSKFDKAIAAENPRSPLNYIIFDDLDSALIQTIPSINLRGGQYIASTEIQKQSQIKDGAALVVYGALESLHGVRKTNEILRSIVPDGCVVYAAYATIVESPEEFKQLSSALRTGARGPHTFKYTPGNVVLFRRRFDRLSPWEKEKELLEKILEEDTLLGNSTENEILDRRTLLKNSGAMEKGLFWHSQNGVELFLQNDFVFLSPTGRETQADVYAMISNLISSAIQENRDPSIPTSVTPNSIRKVLHDTVYSHALIDPNNFAKFNDGILRASFLRAAEARELNYSGDHHCSGLLRNLIVHEIDEWQFSRGQALLEFLVALGTKHLRLCDHHLSDIQTQIAGSIYIPGYAKRIGRTLI